MPFVRSAIVCLVAILVCVPVCADEKLDERLDLGGGRFVKGPILKETAETLFVDLGFTVVAIPKAKVIKRTTVTAADGGTAKKAVTSNAIYRTAQLPEAAVRDNVARVGDAVVKVSTPNGLGSGFIISPDGHVVTNAHVIQGETRIQATLFRKTATAIERDVVDGVEILASNAQVDLALLQLPKRKAPYPFVFVAGEDIQRVGDVAFAIGNPHGLDRSVSQGILSTLNRPFDGLTYIQTTTQINPGNSGGPLFNLRGEVVGVTNMKLVFSEGLNFAIPARRLRWFLENRDAFTYDKDNPNTGYRYLDPPAKPKPPRAPTGDTGNQVGKKAAVPAPSGDEPSKPK